MGSWHHNSPGTEDFELAPGPKFTSVIAGRSVHSPGGNSEAEGVMQRDSNPWETSVLSHLALADFELTPGPYSFG